MNDYQTSTHSPCTSQDPCEPVLSSTLRSSPGEESGNPTVDRSTPLSWWATSSTPDTTKKGSTPPHGQRSTAGIAHLEAVDIWPDVGFYSDDPGEQARKALVKKAAAVETVLTHVPTTRANVAVRFAEDIEGGSDGDVSAVCWKQWAR